ncbi:MULTISPECIES: hypothetical protein [Gammaproteobacteria]|uniref:Uncharacterized protein n=1 Tax=Vreelandella rituensis TaxID=2282306 RepID=A0A368TPF3_9GAMM|nr:MULTISPECIES: hypothetical protein [Gammaproteobacteria]MBQ5557915.1 hypothetical protein [Aeriscardovia sp.]MBQ9003007.1 hypothetical protein [Eggerthellaceae bacterium]MBR2407102.1 hypothetical protein [Clostridia bacterium]MBG9993369.1 hypothetical protein [Pseudoalteromonas sp. NZS37]MBH0013663.1 hypothetical protein [Pseudoalteromonas sp. NZS100_1]
MTPIEWFGLIGFALLGLGFVAHLYKANLNKLRLDALQTYQWKVMCIDGQFAVLEGTPVRQVGAQKPTVREAIDAAILERQHAKTQV